MLQPSPTFAASPTGRPDAAFASARRHSAQVRALKVAAPVAAVAVVLATLAGALIEPLAGPVQVNVAGLGLGEASIAMDGPRLRGVNSQDRAYDVSARTARQTLATPGQVGLDDLDARIGLANDGTATLTSAAGSYDSDAGVLDLQTVVRIVSNVGDDATLQDARVELKDGRIVSDRPVAIRIGASFLRADRMEVLDSGDRAFFSGRVRMTLRHDPAKPMPPVAPPADAP